MKSILYLILPLIMIVGSCRDLDDIINNDPPDPDFNIDKGLIANWTFDDGTANDFSGNNNDGRLMNIALPTTMSIKGKAMLLQGQGNGGSYGGHILLPPIDFESMDAFTISLWVYDMRLYASLSGWGSSYIFFGDNHFGSLGISNRPKIENPDGNQYLCFAVGSAFPNSSAGYPFVYPIYSLFDLNENIQWSHYTLVYKHGTLYAYINAQLIGTKEQKVNIRNKNAAIGRNWWSDGADNDTKFHGIVDEVRIYKRALSRSEVLELYNSAEL